MSTRQRRPRREPPLLLESGAEGETSGHSAPEEALNETLKDLPEKTLSGVSPAAADQPAPSIRSARSARSSIAVHQPMDLPLKLGAARFTHGISPSAMAAAFEDWWSHLSVSPGRQSELFESALRKWLRWQLHLSAAATGHPKPCVNPSPLDKRFSPPQWQSPPYCWMAQGFLLMQQWWDEATTQVRGVSMPHQALVEFVTRQWLDVASPSNFVLSNPQVLQEVFDTGGQNLVRGGANWWRDAVEVLTEADPAGAEDFKPGEAVALTPGKVIFRNRLIELMQYEPTTPQVYPEPVLVVPSWIMKYYVLDLSPANSLVKFLVGHGHTVFMISWKNPDAEDRSLGLEDYLDLGMLAALKAVQSARPGVDIHAMGYCLGGTLLTMGAAALARDTPSPIKSVSLLAAQIDFEEPGELGLFINESQIAFLEDVMSARGYLDGRQMAGAFALINSKDLVWSKLVHEYLMGRQTPLNDLRAWNADATRLPYRMHSEYLRSLYLENDLAEGRFEVHGRPVAVKDIRLPLFVVSTELDHVAPWPSTYKVHLLTDTEVTFVLTSGGHNMGIVNPPSGPRSHPKSRYRMSMRPAGGAFVGPDTWVDTAAQQRGSWWTPWQHWLAERSGKTVPAVSVEKSIERSPLRVLGAAPGRYVHVE